MINNAKILYDSKANAFDGIIPHLIPFYNEIYDILINAIPFSKNVPLKILDIGCGTGTLAKIIKENFPNAKITCLDFSANMLNVAKSKLAKYKDDIDFLVGDFGKFKLRNKFDVIVSSFALHHIQTDEQKIALYKKIYENLNSNGVFYNADLVLGSSVHINSLNYKKWKSYILRYFENIETLDKLLPKYQADDNPSVLFSHLKWLDHVGFKEIETVWKYYNFAIYGGRKTKHFELIKK